MAVTPDIRDLNITLASGHSNHLAKFRLDMSQMSQRIIFETIGSGKMYEQSLARLLTQVLRPGDIFIDVGAHVGFFSIVASYLVGNAGQVLSIEPNAENFRALEAHVTLNERKNFRLVNAVACETDGSVEFYRNSDNDGGHALWDPGLHSFNELSRAETDKDTYPAVRLDILAERYSVQDCRAVKIDTEGAELTVLKGGGEFFRPEKVPFVVCEMHEFGLKQLGASQDGLRAWMRQQGYMTFMFASDGQLPVMVPGATQLQAGHVFNVLFSTPDAIGELWPAVTPFSEY
ncbi:MAG: FkbM family methyltransferase [Proteobacteria bacterium]|nr:FkbM family methyltransferase [Pseudomonadota bacterium]